MRDRVVPFGFILFFVIISFGSPRESHAVPYFAVLANTRCSHCHVSPTGGGMRNDHGVNLYSEYSLKATRRLFHPDFKGRVGKYLAVGADLRVRHLATVEPPRSNSFQITQGSLYVRADPIRHFSIYTDTDVANLTSREAFGLINNLPYHLWIKFGRLNLPYGLRIPDDTSFIRNDLGFNFAAQDLGLEVGLEPGPFTIVASYTNGVPGGTTDDNDNKAATSSVSWLWKIFRLGGSFQWNNRATTRTITGGGMTGLHLWKVALLGEFDIQKVLDKTTGAERTVLVGYGEVDYEIIPGLYFKATYDVIDDRIPGSGLHHRVGTGFELFPMPHLEISASYRVRIGSGDLGDDQIFTILHGFF